MTAPAPFLGRMLCAAAVIALAAFAGPHAAAQKKDSGPKNAVQGFSENRDKPINITAASLTVRDKEKIATFTGDVHVTQGDTELFCKTLLVFYEAEAAAATSASSSTEDPRQQIRRMEAKGGIKVVRRDQVTSAESGIFDIRSNTVTLNGNVVVARGQDVVRGPRLVVDLTTGVSRMEASGGRVEGLFQSSPRGESGASKDGSPVPNPLARPPRTN